MVQDFVCRSKRSFSLNSPHLSLLNVGLNIAAISIMVVHMMSDYILTDVQLSQQGEREKVRSVDVRKMIQFNSILSIIYNFVPLNRKKNNSISVQEGN